MTTRVPFLARFATRIEEQRYPHTDPQPLPTTDACQSFEARRETRFTRVRSETTDDE